MQVQREIEQQVDEFWERHIVKSTILKKQILETEKPKNELKQCKEILENRKEVLQDMKVQGTRDLTAIADIRGIQINPVQTQTNVEYF